MQTPSQTIGPFFGHALPWPAGPYVIAEGAPQGCWITGTVRDGAGDPVPDALIETWQADPGGHYDHPDGFRGFGRCPTDPAGRWAIYTRKPGPVGMHAPHLAVTVFARGLLRALHTRIYFPDEPANPTDPVLRSLAEPARARLLAGQTEHGYAFDIWLQGEHESVFFDL